MLSRFTPHWRSCAAAITFVFSSRRRHTRSKRDWSSDVCSSDLPSANQWYHVAMERSAGTTTFFVNGSQLADTFSNSPSYTAANSFIGNVGGSGRFYNGSLANVQVYNRALSAGEISQISLAPAAVNSGLVGFWPLMGGSTEADRSGQGNTGTLHGATVSSNIPSTALLTAGYGTPLTSLTATGNAITINGVTTTGSQSYTGSGTVSLNGPLTTNSNGNIAVTTAAALTVSQAITANGSGTITLTATGGSSDITTSGAIDSGSGLITLNADNNITLSSGGTVGASTTGAITIAADHDG